VSAVTGLVTFVDVAPDGAEDGRQAGQMTVSARHEAVLDDGRRVLLLNDRGWASSLSTIGQDADAPVPDIWTVTSPRDVVDTARTVVGPDEPFGDLTPEDMAAAHFDHLAEKLRRHGVGCDGPALRGLPHEVVLSERLLARLGR
jgi:hypothetical protein